MEENNKQNICIVKIQKDIEFIKDELKKDNNVKKDMCDRNRLSYTADNVKMEKMIDRLFKEQIKINTAITELKPAQRFYNKIRDFSVGAFIILGGAVITLASYIYHKFPH